MTCSHRRAVAMQKWQAVLRIPAKGEAAERASG